ncbi:MAG: DUF401 family protein [Nitrospirae bacterium]|nr:MAG: DUF401 family protein [Nitrospirota bacterium]
MIDLIKITAVFFLMLLLLRRKMKVGNVLLIASLTLLVLYLPGLDRVGLILRGTFLSRITFVLIVALTAIRMFEMVLREKKVLDGMMTVMESLLRHKKLVVISMPLLIGMMPSVGGAYFSAPMVERATSGMELSAEEKTFANYWYRHPWELILPLYPGIVLASAITELELRSLILLNLPIALTMVIGGLYFIRNISGVERKSVIKHDRAYYYFFPLALLLFMVIGLNMPIEYALVIVVAGLLLYYRYPFRDVLRVVRHGLSPDIVLLIIGVVCFKETLEQTGAVGNISHFLTVRAVPLLPLFIILPFMAGLLTGITVGFVSSTFPLLLSLTEPQPALFSLAFVSGYAGVLLSPVHVCFILTREYFRADMLSSYKRVTPAVVFMLTVSLIEQALIFSL